MILEIEDFDSAVEFVMDMVGSSFEQSLRLSNSIIERPEDFTGPQAARAAVEMANYRYRIGIVAQQWKIKSTQTKKLQDRLVKDSLMAAFTGLEEVINTLKIVARHEHDLSQSR